jgi:hypothetical protein
MNPRFCFRDILKHHLPPGGWVRPPGSDRRRAIASAFLAAAVTCVAGTSASGQFVMQPTVEAESIDAKVYKFLPTFNLQSDLLVVGTAAGDHQFASLLQFDLSSLTMSGADVTGATLDLFSQAIGTNGAGEVGLYLVTSPWSETGVTWNTYPTFGLLIDSVTVDQVGQTYLFDVTSALQGWTSGAFENHGFAIRMISEGGNVTFADVDSSGAANAPKLTVVPEPSVAIAALCGMAVLGSMRRRARKQG